MSNQNPAANYRPDGRTRPPAPPRSRAAGHVFGVLAGLTLPPVALVLVALGWYELAAGRLPGLWALVLGVTVLVALAAVAALASGLALVVGGAFWGLAGHLGRPFVGRVLTDADADLAENLRATLLGALYAGPVVIVAATMAAGGVAVHLARHAGRREERAEVARAGAGVRGTPVPPRSRRWAHVLATVAALALTVGGLLVLGMNGTRHDGGTWEPAALTVAGALLAAAALTGARSSLGPQLAGWLVCVAPSVAVLWFTATGSSDVLAPVVEALFRVTGGPLLTVTGTLLLLGLTLAAGGAAAHWARRAGRRYERADLALARR